MRVEHHVGVLAMTSVIALRRHHGRTTRSDFALQNSNSFLTALHRRFIGRWTQRRLPFAIGALMRAVQGRAGLFKFDPDGNAATLVDTQRHQSVAVEQPDGGAGAIRYFPSTCRSSELPDRVSEPGDTPSSVCVSGVGVANRISISIFATGADLDRPFDLNHPALRRGRFWTSGRHNLVSMYDRRRPANLPAIYLPPARARRRRQTEGPWPPP